MNKKILVVLLAVCMIASSFTAFADTTLQYEQPDDKIILSGTATEDGITLKVFRKEDFVLSDGTFDLDGAFDALEDASDKASVLVYSDQIDATDGNFECAIRIIRYPGLTEQENISGIYTAVINCGEDTVQKDMLYVSLDERDNALTELSKLSTADASTRKAAVTDFIKQNKYTLGIYKEGFDELTPALFDTMLYDKTEEFDYDFTQKEGYISELKKIVAISLLNDSKMTSVDGFKEELGITTEKFNPWYTKKFVDEEFKSALTLRLLGKGINGTDAFDKSLAEALVLLYAERADGVGDVKSIVNTFKGEAGVTSSWSDEAFRSVMGTSFSSYDALFDALSAYGQSDSSSSSGGSKKNYGGGGGINIVVPSTPSQGNTAPAVKEFSDVPNEHWASSAVYALRDKGIIAGKSNDVFAPNDNITREEFVKLVTAMSGVELADGELPFADADQSAWYAKYLASAYKLGIIKGSNDGSFGVGSFITRQDIAVMLVRALELKGAQIPETVQKSEFTDADAVSEYALDAVNKLKSAGVISGYTDGSVRPLGLASRAEAAQMIYKAMLLIK